MMPQLIAAPHLRVYVNGKPTGYLTSFQFSVDTAHREVNAIDNVQAQELVPSSYSVQATFGVLAPRTMGGLEGAGLTVFADQLPRQKYLKIVVVDRVTDRVVFEVISAVLISQTWQAVPRQLMQGNFTIKALSYTSDSYTPDPNGTMNGAESP